MKMGLAEGISKTSLSSTEERSIEKRGIENRSIEKLSIEERGFRNRSSIEPRGIEINLSCSAHVQAATQRRGRAVTYGLLNGTLLSAHLLKAMTGITKPALLLPPQSLPKVFSND